MIERNLGPIGKIEGALSGAGDLGRIASTLPAIAARTVNLLNRADDLTRNGIVLSPESAEAIGRAQARENRWLTAGIWAIAAAILVAVWMLH